MDLFAACKTRKPAWLKIKRKIRHEILESLARVKAEHLIDRMLGALSGGELQRVLLALALDPVPDILLLDEPASGIDQNGLELFYNTVSELREQYDLSIILVSHDLDLISKYADRVVLLNHTVLSSGTPTQVFNDPQTIRVFGMACYMNLADRMALGQGADLDSSKTEGGLTDDPLV
jgi:zinc transport system ATP-binding protein